MKRLAVVVPCYNEEEVLPRSHQVISDLLEKLIAERRIADDSLVFYVDDGSRDGTWRMIETLARESGHVAGLKLSRNCGHQNALMAGLFNAPGDVLVSVDADLQDDVSAIEPMLEEYRQGAEIVFGVRTDRTRDSFFKRQTAQTFYRLMKLFGVDLVDNHADYRLMSRRAVEALKDYREVNLFLRGIVPLLGFRTAVVGYSRQERLAGRSKYSLGRMLSFAWQGLTSFSVMPLRIVTLAGVAVFLFTVVMGLYVLGVRLLTDRAVPGWASTVLPIYFLGGVQIVCIGILGEYLGKTYQEVKNRPRYIVETKLSSRALTNEDDANR